MNERRSFVIPLCRPSGALTFNMTYTHGSRRGLLCDAPPGLPLGIGGAEFRGVPGTPYISWSSGEHHTMALEYRGRAGDFFESFPAEGPIKKFYSRPRFLLFRGCFNAQSTSRRLARTKFHRFPPPRVEMKGQTGRLVCPFISMAPVLGTNCVAIPHPKGGSRKLTLPVDSSGTAFRGAE